MGVRNAKNVLQFEIPRPARTSPRLKHATLKPTLLRQKNFGVDWFRYRGRLNQRTATRDANFDRRQLSAGCAAPGVCALDTGDEIAGCGGSAHGRSVDVIPAGAADTETGE